MTKAELIERIARSRNLPPDITKKDISTLLGIAFEELALYFAKARVTRSSSPRFTFPRFGTFTKKKRSARRGINPRTLEPMQIDASCTVDFKASRELRDLMNGAPPRASRAVGRRSAKAKAGTTRASEGPATSSGVAAKASTVVSVDSAGTPPALAPSARPGNSSRTTRSSGRPSRVELRGRRLTPRDEDAELDALIDDESLFVELPTSRLQRIRPPASDKAAESA